MITMDLRGHGASGEADRYDLEAMAGDVVAVAQVLDLLGEVHLVGHSLGGVVVTAAGAAAPVASVVCVDQGLQLAAFKAQLAEIEGMLRDQSTFQAVIDGIFAELAGSKMSAGELARVNLLRKADQEVVLGVWDILFTKPEEEIEQIMASILGGYGGKSVPYLALFGIDPGPDYESRLASFIDGAQTEVWADHGHYPHLVDPDRFVDRLRTFWG